MSVVAAMAAVAVVVSAGNPNTPPGPPETTSSYRLEDIYDRLDTGTAGTQITFTEPISGPTVGTGHTLDEIMAVAPSVDDTNGATATQVVSGTTYWGLRDGAWGLQTGAMPVQTVDNSTTSQAAGYYNAFDLAGVDTDLVAGNIAQGVDLFGVTGSAVAATGDATPAHVLTGTTFSNGSGSGLSGAMANNGAVTLTPTTTQQTIAAGYHNGSGYVEEDADLVAGNIKADVNLFGITGTLSSGSTYNAGVPKTGQTDCYYDDGTAGTCTCGTAHCTSGQDGDLEMGVDWITDTRFITGTTGTTGVTVVVTDTLTGLVWLQDANCIANQYPDFDSDATAKDGAVTWQHALDFTAGITVTGSYSNCAAGFSDWRLPNVRELQSLIDYGESGPALPDGHPFTGVKSDYYWSSTTGAPNTDYAWVVRLHDGSVNGDVKTGTHYVWPVRGGQ